MTAALGLHDSTGDDSIVALWNHSRHDNGGNRESENILRI